MNDGLRRNSRDAHRPAVSPEHEERRVEPGLGERGCDERRRPLDDGQDARVDRGADRPRLEPVRAGQLVPCARREAVNGRPFGDELLGVRIVDGECGAHGDGTTPFAREREQRLIERVPVHAPRRVQEGVRCLELPVRRETDRPDPGALAGRPQIRLLAEADHADAAHVALQERVHRLRGRERDQLDRVPVDAGQQRPQRVGDALRDTVVVRMRRGNRRVCAQLPSRRADCDRLRERAADVDPDAKPAHARAASGRARPNRFQPKR